VPERRCRRTGTVLGRDVLCLLICDIILLSSDSLELGWEFQHGCVGTLRNCYLPVTTERRRNKKRRRIAFPIQVMIRRLFFLRPTTSFWHQYSLVYIWNNTHRSINSRLAYIFLKRKHSKKLRINLITKAHKSSFLLFRPFT